MEDEAPWDGRGGGRASSVDKVEIEGASIRGGPQIRIQLLRNGMLNPSEGGALSRTGLVAAGAEIAPVASRNFLIAGTEDRRLILASLQRASGPVEGWTGKSAFVSTQNPRYWSDRDGWSCLPVGGRGCSEMTE